mmetsp:Transcript_105628/g.209869  ORF Transcript_105628/g.209869 Transcript_105628/m.209869 type:complete len:519 (+) Transcript_105628:307-1863(+)
MTGYSKHEILGRNCRILSKDCPLNQQDAFDLRQTCKTGQPFTGVLLNRTKSGHLFQNLVDLRGLTVAANPHTKEKLWFVVGIQADVTHVSEDELPPDHFAALQSVVGIIREKISDELSTLAVAGLHVIEREQIRTDSPEMWWMLPEPTFVQGSDDEATVSLSVSDIERQTSEELGTSQPPRRQTSVVPDIVDMSMPDVLKTQGIEVDACALSLLEMSSIKETIGQAVLGCQFCVTISDPRLPDCPVVAVSDHFQTITGYAREDVVGNNVAAMLSSGCKLGNLDKEQLRRASETGEPYTKVFVHRKKTGELFLDLMDLRGLNVAHNPRTNDNIWFLVCIQADVTHMGEENIPAHQMKQLHEVAECLRSALADRVAAMGVAGMLTHPSASKDHRSTHLWCPLRVVGWKQDPRKFNKTDARVRQVSFGRSCSSNTRQPANTCAGNQDGDLATSSGVTELIQQTQQQRQQQPPPPQEAEPTLSMRQRLWHRPFRPFFVISIGLLFSGMGYAFRKHRKGVSLF